MEVRKERIEIELSKQEENTLTDAATILHGLMEIMSREECNCCYSELYGDEFTYAYIEDIQDTLNRLTEITEIY